MSSRWVTLPPLRPGQEPTRNLARSIAKAFTDRGLTLELNVVEARLRKGSGGLRELAIDLGARAGDGSSFVLAVVDQAEELITRSGPREQQAFLGLLRDALGEDSPLWIVATVRSEFLSTAPDRSGLAEIIDDSVVLEPLSRSTVGRSNRTASATRGIDFEPGLVERMALETAGGDALPLLAYALSELYKRIGQQRRITVAQYYRPWVVWRARCAPADPVAEALRQTGRPVLPTLVELATVDGAGEPTRRRIRQETLDPDERAVVDAFVDARLLTSDGVLVEVAHEALLRRWPPLREAIEDARSWLRLRSELDRLAADWQHGGRDDLFLVRGARLAMFEHWSATIATRWARINVSSSMRVVGSQPSSSRRPDAPTDGYGYCPSHWRPSWSSRWRPRGCDPGQQQGAGADPPRTFAPNTGSGEPSSRTPNRIPTSLAACRSPEPRPRGGRRTQRGPRHRARPHHPCVDDPDRTHRPGPRPRLRSDRSNGGLS